jgi:pyrimidine-nucleoside phosphorylase
MRAVDVIIRKRDRYELTRDEIGYFIRGYTTGEIPDYQAAAFSMAVLLNGMTPRETTDLTMAMANSGKIIDLSNIVPIAVDKHSTGGVGDKTSLVVEPVVAACGLAVGKMSGRGLGFTGGTLDKLESIPGYRTDLSTQEFIDQLRQIGLVLTGQSADLAPADGKLYALRDVTGTVNSIPLIASSIMSKKIAAGAQAIVLDVKVGSGAFMETLDEGRQLARLLVDIARLAGRKAVALLSDMNQPLGYAVGNSLEVREAIDTLHGHGPADFTEHCLVLAGHLLALGEKARDPEAGRAMAQQVIENGKAWECFRRLVQAQGGDLNAIDFPESLLQPAIIETILAPQTGFLVEINALTIGEAAMRLGAGREKKEQPIDHAVGVVLHHKVGDLVVGGQPLFTLYANQPDKLAEARQSIQNAHRWSENLVEPLPLFYDVIDGL